MAIRSSIDMRTVITTKDKTFSDLSHGLTPWAIAKPVSLIATGWIKSNGMKEAEDTAVEFAFRIIKNEPTWTLLDVACFFDFISSNQHDARLKVYGDRVTPLRLLEMISVYEERKAMERERIHEETKSGATVSAPRESTDKSVKAVMGRELERIAIQNDQIKEQKPAPDEKWFNSQRNSVPDES